MNRRNTKFVLKINMGNTQDISVFWFRRDLRLQDNTALFHALTSGLKVLPVFIFDTAILRNLNPDDKRISFIHQALKQINVELVPYKSSVQLFYGTVPEVFDQLLSTYKIKNVFVNHDYEPYAIQRDDQVSKMLELKGVKFHSFKDQVIFEKNEILKLNGEPYTVFTPYKNKWLEELSVNSKHLNHFPSEDFLYNFTEIETNTDFNLFENVFVETKDIYKKFELNKSVLENYDKTRDFPALNSTSKASVHLRFGTISVRRIVKQALYINTVWLSELIWREFFMQMLWHFPKVINQPFKSKYQFIKWINDENDFKAWCSGNTGYPLVDAGMRELNETGFMHNRVRMVTASFLVKHLLINWQWGEAYFAEKLLDFELSSNNGNWQWAAGTGCDAAPYFRIFNPITQAEKFDPDNEYIKKWVPEYNSSIYVKPIIDHSFARLRCLETYKASL